MRQPRGGRESGVREARAAWGRCGPVGGVERRPLAHGATPLREPTDGSVPRVRPFPEAGRRGSTHSALEDIASGAGRSQMRDQRFAGKRSESARNLAGSRADPGRRRAAHREACYFRASPRGRVPQHGTRPARMEVARPRRPPRRSALARTAPNPVRARADLSVERAGIDPVAWRPRRATAAPRHPDGGVIAGRAQAAVVVRFADGRLRRPPGARRAGTATDRGVPTTRRGRYP